MECYQLRIHAFPKGLLVVPSHYVNNRDAYTPSPALADRSASLSKKRIPSVIGSISEQMAIEILSDGKITIESRQWDLKCNKLRALTQQLDWIWKPGFGIYCDDLATIASDGTNFLLFITECKGTTLKRGLSRQGEAKIFYQLARTYEKMKRTSQAGNPFELAGVISVLVNHATQIVTINVNDNTSSLSGGLPDSWMYQNKAPSEF